MEYELLNNFHQTYCQPVHSGGLKFEPLQIIGQQIVDEKTAEDSNSRQGGLILCLQPTIEEDWTLEQIVQRTTPTSWQKVFSNAYPELKKVEDQLINEVNQYGDYYPRKKNLFRAFDVCPLDKVKVVIIGQDPYYTAQYDSEPTAQGMSFSIKKGVQITSSLKNVFTELERSMPGFITPYHGDLTEWASQGVLLLNMSLTARPGVANKHAG